MDALWSLFTRMNDEYRIGGMDAVTRDITLPRDEFDVLKRSFTYAATSNPSLPQHTMTLETSFGRIVVTAKD